MASFPITPGYSWTDGDLVTATRLNSAFSAATVAAIDGIPIGGTTPDTGGFTRMTVKGNTPTNADAILQNSGGAADEKYWTLRNNSSLFSVSAINDADTNINPAYRITRTGDQPVLHIFYTGTSSAALSMSPTGTSILKELSLPLACFRNTAAFLKSADTSLAAITGLSATIQASGIYLFRCKFYCVASGTGGFKFDVSGTATASSAIVGLTALGSLQAVSASYVTAFATPLSANSASLVPTIIEVSGSFVCSGTGTFGPRFAQATASGSSQIEAGSTFEIRRLN